MNFNIDFCRAFIDYNKISQAGLVAIAEALAKNVGIRYISVWGNTWSDQSLEVRKAIYQLYICTILCYNSTNRDRTSIFQTFGRLMGKIPSVNDSQGQEYRQRPIPGARLQYFMTDVKFYVAGNSIFVAHVPREKDEFVIQSQKY